MKTDVSFCILGFFLVHSRHYLYCCPKVHIKYKISQQGHYYSKKSKVVIIFNSDFL